MLQNVTCHRGIVGVFSILKLILILATSIIEVQITPLFLQELKVTDKSSIWKMGSDKPAPVKPRSSGPILCEEGDTLAKIYGQGLLG